MSVRIIRQNNIASYSLNNKKIRIEFNDGTHMLGFINLHSKYIGNQGQDDPTNSLTVEDAKYKFFRTSDYLKDCHPNEGMLTVFNGMYGGSEFQVCFVFLHSVKFITEEKELPPATEENPPSQPEELPQTKSKLFLRDRLKRDD
jgi:hypothetical protein